MSVRPSVRMEQLGRYLMDFYEMLYLNMFRKTCQENSSFITICQQ